MKKSIFRALLTMASLAFAASAFAGALEITTSGTTIGGSAYKPSTNVKLSVIANATFYSVTGAHLNGTKEYGAKSADQSIWFKEKVAGAYSTAVTTSNEAFGSGWSSL